MLPRQENPKSKTRQIPKPEKKKQNYNNNYYQEPEPEQGVE